MTHEQEKLREKLWRICEKMEDYREAAMGDPNVWEVFDVPEHRKDLSRPGNAAWILRNLSIRNRDHPMLHNILSLAKMIVREESDEC